MSSEENLSSACLPNMFIIVEPRRLAVRGAAEVGEDELLPTESLWRSVLEPWDCGDDRADPEGVEVIRSSGSRIDFASCSRDRGVREGLETLLQELETCLFHNLCF
jgi:hypothetical protein